MIISMMDGAQSHGPGVQRLYTHPRGPKDAVPGSHPKAAAPDLGVFRTQNSCYPLGD